MNTRKDGTLSLVQNCSECGKRVPWIWRADERDTDSYHYLQCETCDDVVCDDCSDTDDETGRTTCRTCLETEIRVTPQGNDIEELHGLIVTHICPICSCPGLDKIPFDLYEHQWGWNLKGYGKRQWLSVKCPKCKHEWSANHLGVPRN